MTGSAMAGSALTVVGRSVSTSWGRQITVPSIPAIACVRAKVTDTIATRANNKVKVRAAE